jgi:enoyl-CoA hydratase
MSTSTDLVKVEHWGEIALVTLNRPEAMNALSRALGDRIGATFAELQAAGRTRVAILTGAGRAFCAGVDFKELASGDSMLYKAEERPRAGVTKFGLAAFDGPIIGAINGYAITGGLELALGCDIRIASTQARFADTHARVGVIPGGRASALLSRLVGLGRAKEMSLTGNYIDAATAERWGLVNRVVEPAALIPTCRKLAEDMLTIAPDMLRAYNRLIEQNHEMTYADAVENEDKVSRAAHKKLTPESIGKGLDAVKSRGRSQNG